MLIRFLSREFRPFGKALPYKFYSFSEIPWWYLLCLSLLVIGSWGLLQALIFHNQQVPYSSFVPLIIVGFQLLRKRKIAIPTNQKQARNRMVFFGLAYLGATLLLGLLFDSLGQIFHKTLFCYWFCGFIAFLTIILINDLALVRFLHKKKQNSL